MEKVVSSETKYIGKIINVRLDNVKSDKDKKLHYREIVEHPGGVVIIPVTDEGEIILIKQWRYPIGHELIELPAGKLEKGEDPFEAAKRELTEETGYIAEEWRDLGYIYTAPGFCDERLYLYKASGLTFTETNFDEGEFIETFPITLNNAKQMIKEGKINDAKTIAGINLI